jgi:hypothetical protein
MRIVDLPKSLSITILIGEMKMKKALSVGAVLIVGSVVISVIDNAMGIDLRNYSSLSRIIHHVIYMAYGITIFLALRK